MAHLVGLEYMHEWNWPLNFHCHTTQNVCVCLFVFSSLSLQLIDWFIGGCDLYKRNCHSHSRIALNFIHSFDHLSRSQSASGTIDLNEEKEERVSRALIVAARVLFPNGENIPLRVPVRVCVLQFRKHNFIPFNLNSIEQTKTYHATLI